MRVWRERCSLPQNESVAARMRREVRRLAASETARKHATQFLWSYIFFIMISLVFGMAHLSDTNTDTDFMLRFGVLIWSTITGAVITRSCAMPNALPMQ